MSIDVISDAFFAYDAAVFSHAARVRDCAPCPSSRFSWDTFVKSVIGPQVDPYRLDYKQFYQLSLLATRANALEAANDYMRACPQSDGIK